MGLLYSFLLYEFFFLLPLPTSVFLKFTYILCLILISGRAGFELILSEEYNLGDNRILGKIYFRHMLFSTNIRHSQTPFTNESKFFLKITLHSIR